MYTVDFLRSRRVWFEALLHSPASSAARRAHHIHVSGSRVAKTVLVQAGSRWVVAVLPSTANIDLERLGAVVLPQASEVRLATTDEVVGTFTDCEPGVVPPFGHLYELGTVFDSSLLEATELVFGGNTRHEGLRMHTRDYLEIEEPILGSFARPIDGAQTDAAHSLSSGLRAG